MKWWSERMNSMLWIMSNSVVFNFQREKTVAGNKERKVDTQYGERQRWRKVTPVKRLKSEPQHSAFFKRGVAIMLQKLESPGPGEYRKALWLPKFNPMALYISIIQVIQFLETQHNPIETKMLERGSSNSKS